MANRTREVILRVAVNPEEEEIIRKKMAQIGTNNFGLYARKMLIDGYVIKRDFGEIRALARELANLARSINQIAKRCNETRNLHEPEVLELQKMYGEVRSKVTERLVKMAKNERG